MSGVIGVTALETPARSEAEGLLVGPPGFKPVVPVTSWKVGSIPMRLRHSNCAAGTCRNGGRTRAQLEALGFQLSAFGGWLGA